jgi:uncharacterized protein YkwD
MGALACVALVGVAAIAGCATNNNPPPGLPGIYQNMAQSGAKLDIHAAQALISSYRTSNGREPVTIDPTLMKLAQAQATAMAAHDKLEHDVVEPFKDRIQNSSFDASVAVENIAAGYETLASAFSGWRNSPPHRANMLDPAVTRMGIAAAYAPKTQYKVFWSLILAKPERQQQNCTPLRPCPATAFAP